MSAITTKDGTRIYYKDWGSGQPVVFSHGWPLSSDAWDDQMLFLADRGYRCIAHDRRGHAAVGEFVDWESGFEIEIGGIGHLLSLRGVGVIAQPAGKHKVPRIRSG